MASKTENLQTTQGILLPKNAFVVIIKTEWNSAIVNELEAGVLKVLGQHQVTHKTYTVPGAVELPFAVQKHYKSAINKANAYIVLGTVIKGGTPHFDYVCKMVSEGVALLNNELNVPTIFGVLTLNNEAEAYERLGGVHGHKGEEAGVTALKMISYIESINA